MRHDPRQIGFRTTLAFAVMAAFLGTAAFDARVNRAADQPSSKAIQRAHDFLKTETTGKYILGFVHMGARYNGHEVVERREVARKGRMLPGHFALVYDFDWEADGTTQLAFLCDADGDVYDVQVLKTNAFLNSPFDLAKLSIAVLGEVILEAFKDNMTAKDKEQVQSFIKNADPEAMLELGLKLRQALNVK